MPRKKQFTVPLSSTADAGDCELPADAGELDDWSQPDREELAAISEIIARCADPERMREWATRAVLTGEIKLTLN